MRTSYDPEADAMFVWFAPEDTKSANTSEVAPGILLDYDAAGNVIGIEILVDKIRRIVPSDLIH
jgi:uncharacterized protein YuzE